MKKYLVLILWTLFLNNSFAENFNTNSIFSAPTVTTLAASSVSSSTASLNGIGNPNNEATTSWFRYSTVSPGTPNDTFGTRTPIAGGTNLGSGNSSVAFDRTITSLLPGTTYYYCAIASNASGTSFGSLLSFTTPGISPTITTSSTTLVTSSSATLNGSGVPNGAITTGWFRYSTTDPGVANDSFGSRAPVSGGSNLGSGNAAVSYSRAISGLSPNTTYYYCAIGSNSEGTSFGTVSSFTTPPSTPIVTSGNASSATGTSATLNGSANPGGDATTGWFRYSTVSPGTMNDSFGTRVPASGGAALGSGISTAAYSFPISGLMPGTTYYYGAIAQNSIGISFGTLKTFTTPSPPTAVTNTASTISSSDANLNGSGTPNGASSTGWFRYSTTDPGVGNDVFGTRTPISGGASLGNGNSVVAFSQSITSLSPSTTYYYCAIVQNAEGTSFGTVQSFKTTGPPTIVTNTATSITSSTATLNGTGNPNSTSTTGWYRYSTTDPGVANDSFGSRAPVSGGSSLGSGTSAVSFNRTISGLLPNTTYYYCAIGSNSEGMSFGQVLSFTTPAAAPIVSTGGRTFLTGTTVTLNGSGNPGGAATTGWFRYSTTSPGTTNDSFGTRAPTSGGPSLGSGNTTTTYSVAITGLTPGTTYYYGAIAQNSVGIGFGTLSSFTTPLPPNATTNAATLLEGTTGVLNGAGNSNGASTTGWFRYSTSNPGTCNDTFGNRVPVAGGTSLGSGNTAQAYSQSISGLIPGTTYYYCGIASSFEGTSFGNVVSFVAGANCTSMFTVKSGLINDLSVWSCGRIPLQTDNILVSTGDLLTVPAGIFKVNEANVFGTIHLSTGGELKIK